MSATSRLTLWRGQLHLVGPTTTGARHKEIWAIRVRLQLANRRRELALFNLAIDSKLRACDLVKLRVRDVCHGGGMASRAIVQKPNVRYTLRLRRRAVGRSALGSATRV